MTAATPLRLVTLLAAILAVAACQRREPATIQVPGEDAAAETADAGDTADEAAPGTIPDTDVLAATPTTEAEAGVQPVQETIAGVDPKAFAGTFAAQGTTLELAADGSYTMTVRAESAGADLRSSGTWSAEDDGKRILLDPDSKSEQDRTYAVVSADELKAADGAQVLKRGGAH